LFLHACHQILTILFVQVEVEKIGDDVEDYEVEANGDYVEEDEFEDDF
jgi:hypothetical protein